VKQSGDTPGWLHGNNRLEEGTASPADSRFSSFPPRKARSRMKAGEDSNVARRSESAGLRWDAPHNILGAFYIYPIIQGFTSFAFAATARTMDSIP
jgi:hypothetical protein